MPKLIRLMLLSVVMLPISSLFAQSDYPVTSIADINYANVDGHALMLDLYLPQGAENPPLLVFVHGGA